MSATNLGGGARTPSPCYHQYEIVKFDKIQKIKIYRCYWCFNELIKYGEDLKGFEEPFKPSLGGRVNLQPLRQLYKGDYMDLTGVSFNTADVLAVATLVLGAVAIIWGYRKAISMANSAQLPKRSKIGGFYPPINRKKV